MGWADKLQDKAMQMQSYLTCIFFSLLLFTFIHQIIFFLKTIAKLAAEDDMLLFISLFFKSSLTFQFSMRHVMPIPQKNLTTTLNTATTTETPPTFSTVFFSLASAADFNFNFEIMRTFYFLVFKKISLSASYLENRDKNEESFKTILFKSV